MNTGNRLRVVALTILISIVMISFCPFGQMVCYAADGDLAVSVSVPKWSYDEFSYSNVTVSGTTDTKKIKTISIHTENGYIVGSSLPNISAAGGKWSTELPETHNEKTTYQTAVGNLGSSGYSGEEVENLIKSIKFMLESYDQEITVIIDLDATDTSLPEGTNVTRGTGALSDHYYMYVPAEKISWSEAYNAAKNMTFMGMDGYLVTVTCIEEDKILDNITMDGAWAGGVMVKKDAIITTSTADSWYSVLSSVPYDNLNEYVWKWVNGPEKDKMIKISNSAAWKKKAIDPATAKETDGKNLYKAVSYDADGKPLLDTGDYFNYSNWNRNLYYYENPNDTEGIYVDLDDIDPDNPKKHPFDGDEPNDSNGEYCMQVHYESTGRHSPESMSENRLTKGWNDLPNSSTLITVSGYFVEFNGLNYSAQSHAEIEEDQPYEHTWQYTPQSSTGGSTNDEIKITCVNPDHEKCFHKEDDDKEIETIIKLSASNMPYSTDQYDKEAVKLYVGGEEKSLSALSDYGLSDSKITVKYVGRDGTEYAESTTPPVNAGKYTVKTVVDCGGDKITLEKDFAISKVNLKITLNDQSVKRYDHIDKSYDEIGVDKGLIKEIEGLQGEGADADKIDFITEDAIKGDTTKVGTTEDGISIDGPYSGDGHTIVIKDKNGKDVTENYNITVEKGNLYVSMKEPGIILPDPTAEDIIYGQKLSESKITGNFEDSETGEKLKGTISWDDPDILPKVKEGKDGSEPREFEATFYPEDDETYAPVHVKIKIKVAPKDIKDGIEKGGDKGITADISMDLTNEAIIELYDKQTKKKLIEGTDYTVSEDIDTTNKKVKITIKGIENYKNEYVVYKDLWSGRIITQEVYDSSADELNPTLQKISEENGTRLLLDKIDRLDQSDNDKKKAHDIVHKIIEDGASATGDFRALISVYISNADSTVTSQEKSCAESSIGAKTGGKTQIPKTAVIGTYFDVSMDVQYYVEDKTTEPSTILVKKTEEIHDTSSNVLSPSGFTQTVTINVPNRLKPEKNHTRKYYIIRVHDDNAISKTTPSYSYTVMPVKQKKYELTFETDKFSKYALVYTDTRNSGGSEDSGDSGGSGGSSSSSSSGAVTAPITNTVSNMPTTVQVAAPKTGDTADMVISLIMIAAGVILLAVYGAYALINKK